MLIFAIEGRTAKKHAALHSWKKTNWKLIGPAGAAGSVGNSSTSGGAWSHLDNSLPCDVPLIPVLGYQEASNVSGVFLNPNVWRVHQYQIGSIMCAEERNNRVRLPKFCQLDPKNPSIVSRANQPFPSIPF
ncbi:hypothetical protein AC249_AIPGENE1851 [Exaiptasia diaphana]|nr:hypothetical protein AC249_AIPGENE1851 [Exaiptasia diaphana]